MWQTSYLRTPSLAGQRQESHPRQDGEPGHEGLRRVTKTIPLPRAQHHRCLRGYHTQVMAPGDTVATPALPDRALQAQTTFTSIPPAFAMTSSPRAVWKTLNLTLAPSPAEKKPSMTAPKPRTRLSSLTPSPTAPRNQSTTPATPINPINMICRTRLTNTLSPKKEPRAGIPTQTSTCAASSSTSWVTPSATSASSPPPSSSG